MAKKWYTTDNHLIFFEDTSVGKLKKEILDASEEKIDKILAEYEIPSPSELGKSGCYIQNTPRAKCIEKRRKNDILFLPIGCTENHGLHANSGLDTFMVTQILEGVRRYTAKQGGECNLAFALRVLVDLLHDCPCHGKTSTVYRLVGLHGAIVSGE